MHTVFATGGEIVFVVGSEIVPVVGGESVFVVRGGAWNVWFEECLIGCFASRAIQEDKKSPKARSYLID